MLVCLCEGVSRQEIERARDQGATTVDELARACGAGSGCGGCHEALRCILAAPRAGEPPAPARLPARVGPAPPG